MVFENSEQIQAQRVIENTALRKVFEYVLTAYFSQFFSTHIVSMLRKNYTYSLNINTPYEFYWYNLGQIPIYNIKSIQQNFLNLFNTNNQLLKYFINI